MAKRKTLFDDRPVEISELTYIIRQDIASLNSQIAQLQAYIKSSKGGKGGSAASGGKGKGSGGKQEEEHNNNVVMLLQSRLANMGMGFKDVLELRTQNMKASKDRTEQFMHTAQGSSVLAPAESESFLSSDPFLPRLPAIRFALVQPTGRPQRKIAGQHAYSQPQLCRL